jgi:hypothetical protein
VKENATRPPPDIPIEELAERYQAGATLAEMAALYRSLGYRVIPDEICRRLIAVGIRIRLIDPHHCSRNR